MSKDNIKCSFCGKDKQDTHVLIAGINGHICDECITQAQGIVKEEVVVKDKMLLEGNEGIGRILVESNWGDGTIIFEDVVDDTAKILSSHGITFEDKKFRISGSAAADITALTDEALIALDFEDAQNFSVTLAGNRITEIQHNLKKIIF